ncbi:hypothetical protein F5Y19DRAFT_369723 [Xylariaceae sp. FL1651]|nr:hypothetical protein F5Y19DRAFT_369723 [Xylariaceae sp. FL1651]
MLLLNLPPELLHRIVQDSIPEGFENLILSCRTLYNVGSPFIERYSARKKQYYKASIPGTDIKVSLYWLDQIALEPALSWYMNEVDLRGREAHSDRGSYIYEHSREIENLRNNEPTMQRVKALIERSLYMTPGGVDPRFWAEQILSDIGDPDQYTEHNLFLGIFLLTLLPNVTKLTLPWHSSGLVPFSDAARSIDQCKRVLNTIQQESRSGRDRRALSNLRRLIYDRKMEYNNRERLDFISPLLILPKLESLLATSQVAVDYHMDFKWQYPGIESNLQTIELVHSCMDAVSVSELLAHTPRLISFKYSHASKHHGLGAYWDAGEFVAAIERHRGKQLRHLAITIESHSLNGIDAGVTSMHGFTQLETLEMDFMFFCGPSIESGEKVGILNMPPKPGYPEWTVEAIPHIQDILPTCLQSFHLFFDVENCLSLDSAALIPFYSGFRSAHSSTFPNLVYCVVQIRGSRHDYISPSNLAGSSESQDLDTTRKHLEAEGVECRSRSELLPPWRLFLKW